MQIKTIASLFCGAGGVEAGAVKAGIEPIWGIDNNWQMLELHRHNFPSARSFNKDLRITLEKEFISNLEVPDILHLSPPCQNYSAMSHAPKNSQEAGYRVSDSDFDLAMVDSAIAFIDAMLPPIITIENVAKYLTSEAFLKLIHCLGGNGYQFTTEIVQIGNWNLPQSRRRLVLVAHRIPANTEDLRFQFYPPCPNRKGTIGEAFNGVFDEFEEVAITRHQLDKMKLEDRMRVWDEGESALVQKMGIYTGTKVRYSDDKCWTLLASSGGTGRFDSDGYAKGHRKVIMNWVKRGVCYSVSQKGLARLQGFPDDYDFMGHNNAVVMHALGNSVPPSFYCQLVEQIKEQIC